MLDKEAVIRELFDSYPAIKQALDKVIEKASFEEVITSFSTYTQVQIDNEQIEEIKKCLITADYFLLNGNDEVKNVICGIYLTKLNTKGKKISNNLLIIFVVIKIGF